MTDLPHPTSTGGTGASTPVDVAAEAGQPSLPLAFLGHDLRAALADMRAGLGLLCDLNFPDTVQDTLRRCVASGEALTRLIDQSVLVCLGEAAPGLTQPEEIATDEFLTTLRRRWTLQALETGHRFQVIAGQDLPPRIVTDRTALDRILSNLIANALRHTPPCDVTLHLSQDQTAQQALCFELADGGPGFGAAQIDKLSQGQCISSVIARPGSGIGLQSVAFLVQALGGSIAFGNRPEGGAVIRISLPIARTSAMSERSTAPALPVPARSLKGLRVLVAEDSTALSSVLETQLTRLGAKVTTVADGQAAVQALASVRPMPEVLILDEEMPGMSGLQVLTWMASHLPAEDHPAVLALTCHASTSRIRALTEAGAVLVRSKPILDIREMEQTLRQVLATQAAQVSPDKPADPFPALRRLADIAGPDAAAELFLRLAEDLERARVGLVQAAQDGDTAALRQHSHVLIALAGTAGATALHDDAVLLNGLAHSGGAAERLKALAVAMNDGISDLLSAVQALAPEAGPFEGVP